MFFRNTFSIVLGIIFIVIGLIFMTWSNVLFISFAEGTMSELDAPKKMVVLGPYRFVRNPIAIATITILWGEAVLFGSIYLFLWSIIYWISMHLFLIYKEEPELEEKFGKSYVKYKESVPRWVPLDKAIEFDPE